MGALQTTMLITGASVLAYLVGAFPTGLLLARVKGVDIRRVGSGNIGATNVYRCVGRGWGGLTFAIDLLKGYLPAAFLPVLCRKLGAEISGAHLALLYGCLAVVGHNWPVYLRFRGGKGMATGAGALLGIAPLVLLAGALGWVMFFLATRYVSLASMLAAVLTAACSWCIYRGQILIPAALSLMGIIIIWRHKTNLRRLLAGTEYRFNFGGGARKDKGTGVGS